MEPNVSKNKNPLYFISNWIVIKEKKLVIGGMLTIGKYLRFRRPEVLVHDGERECGGGARRGSLVSHLTQRRVQGAHKVMIMIILTEYDASY